MKKILLLIAAVVTLSACHFLDLTDPDAFDESKFYKNSNDMETLLGSSYDAYRSAINQMFFVTEMKSDNTGTTDLGSSGGLYGSFVIHNVNSSNSIVANLYGNLSKMNHRANLVISHIDDCKWDGDTVARARILDEAKFLRALGHFYMTTLWGNTVKMDVIFSTGDANKAKRSSASEIYEFIIKDLNDVIAANHLPATYDANDVMYGHATLTAAYALLGRVCLQYAATQNHPEKYQDAIAALNAIVADAPALDTYAKTFDVNNKTNKEVIFAVQYLPTEEQGSPFCTYFQPTGAKGLTSYGTGRGWNAGLNNLADEFKAQTATDGRAKTAVVLHSSSNTYYTKKFVDKTNYLGLGGNNWYELRYADVFLMLAEAYEHEGNKTEAVKYLDKVRTRTGNGLEGWEATVQNDAAYAASYSDLKAAIFHERRLEFCFENLRWLDLARMYPDKNDFAAHMRSIVDNSPAASNKFTDFAAYEVLLPVPFDELYLNPGLGQNDGY